MYAPRHADVHEGDENAESVDDVEMDAPFEPFLSSIGNQTIVKTVKRQPRECCRTCEDYFGCHGNLQGWDEPVQGDIPEMPVPAISLICQQDYGSQSTRKDLSIVKWFPCHTCGLRTKASKMKISSSPNHLFITKRVYMRSPTTSTTNAMNIELTMRSAFPRVTGLA